MPSGEARHHLMGVEISMGRCHDPDDHIHLYTVTRGMVKRALVKTGYNLGKRLKVEASVI